MCVFTNKINYLKKKMLCIKKKKKKKFIIIFENHQIKKYFVDLII